MQHPNIMSLLNSVNPNSLCAIININLIEDKKFTKLDNINKDCLII